MHSYQLAPSLVTKGYPKWYPHDEIFQQHTYDIIIITSNRTLYCDMLSSCYIPILLLYLPLFCLTALVVVEAVGNTLWVFPPPPSTTSDSDKQVKNNQQTKRTSWYVKFGTNVNYRITAILDVNGGSTGSPNFEDITKKDAKPNTKFDDDTSKSKQNVKTPGYSIPVSVITISNPQTNTYHQRISYYSDKQIDYNVNGQTYKVIDNPYTGKRRTAERVHDPNRRVCFPTGGNSTNKVGYLNFFPTVEQMKHYTLGKLVTSEVSDESGLIYIGVGFQTKVKLLSLVYINRVLGPDSHGILQFTLHHCLFIMECDGIINICTIPR